MTSEPKKTEPIGSSLAVFFVLSILVLTILKFFSPWTCEEAKSLTRQAKYEYDQKTGVEFEKRGFLADTSAQLQRLMDAEEKERDKCSNNN